MTSALHAAFETGDLATIAAYVAQSHVQDHIRRTNEFIRTHRKLNGVFKLRDGSYPWYCCPGPHLFNTTVLLIKTIQNDHDHVLNWLLSSERPSILDPTLFHLAAYLPCYVDTGVKTGDARTRGIEFLERLAASPYFTDDLSAEQQQELLTRIASVSRNAELTRVALAHGACVNDLIEPIACSKVCKLVDLVLDEGAFFVGAEVLHLAAYAQDVSVAERLLELGVDWGNTNGKPLVTAAQRMCAGYNLVEVLVDNWFSDVDAREVDGWTALMELGTIDAYSFVFTYWDNRCDVATTLVSAGANKHLTDSYGRTAADIATAHKQEKLASLIISFEAEIDEEEEDLEFYYAENIL